MTRGGDGRAAALVLLAFSFALGVSNLAVPLLALDAGYSAAAIGLIAAVAAVAQLVVRLWLPWLLGVTRDRSIILAACAAMFLAYAMLFASKALMAFVVAQLLFGAARALFWTASQTHALRTGGTAVASLARVALMSNIGSMLGPVAAGTLATVSFQWVVVLGATPALVGMIATTRLAALEPYERGDRRGRRRMWLVPGIDVACWASFAAGGWRALLSSYVPVVLTVAGLSPGAVGWLVGVGDATGLAASATLHRLPGGLVRSTLIGGVAIFAGAVVVLPFVASSVWLAALCVAIGGCAASAATSLAPAVASDSVDAARQGDVLALSGTFRAAALLAVPGGVAGAVAVVGLTGGMVLAGVTMAAPVALASLRRR